MNRKPDGEGIFYYANGDKYEGEVKEGYRFGRGKYTAANGNIFSGYYVKEVLEGIGYCMHNGNFYEGEFKEGKANGYGKYRKANGEHYEGYFKDDLYHGRGVYHYVDGSVYEGEFERMKPHGIGCLQSADGKKLVGQFREGVFVTTTGIPSSRTGFSSEVPSGLAISSSFLMTPTMVSSNTVTSPSSNTAMVSAAEWAPSLPSFVTGNNANDNNESNSNNDGKKKQYRL